jgi:NAD+--asparagine ADP-ribosyltransferase
MIGIKIIRSEGANCSCADIAKAANKAQKYKLLLKNVGTGSMSILCRFLTKYFNMSGKNIRIKALFKEVK